MAASLIGAIVAMSLNISRGFAPGRVPATVLLNTVSEMANRTNPFSNGLGKFQFMICVIEHADE
ncbi:uncharacterized protein RSE6_03276 [Rhynchosporium secalis]|uniref:Uncharacterized protein n=1 Tax=Rhynchosporium secalis TaxID=38038 RepID=A0A1E1M2E2_RHYSE|nr:uncharacterized protein RSE6_03276 [Rhynchosporium secalis]